MKKCEVVDVSDLGYGVGIVSNRVAGELFMDLFATV